MLACFSLSREAQNKAKYLLHFQNTFHTIYVTMDPQDNSQQMPQQQTSQQEPMQQMHTPRHQAPKLNKGELSQKVQQLFILFYTALSVVLTARFIFSLLGSNTSSPFVNFVYQISQPFITPFANMFGVSVQAGMHRVEFEDLAALLVYALVFFGLAKLLSIIFD